jgi:hypothetical protein
MPKTVLMMGNSQREANLIGEPCKADGWYNHVGGLHTVVMQVINFTGRLSIEASLELNPTENDWFIVKLDNSDYVEFPLNPYEPTGDYDSGGDSTTIGFTFKVNALWLRAKLDRTYISDILYEADRLALAKLGNVVKITLAR